MVPVSGDEIFLITSRLPDCHDPSGITLTRQRGYADDGVPGSDRPDPVRFGYARGAGGAKPTILLSDAAAWRDTLKASVERSGGAGALIFFHGYNNAPEDTLRRAAMIRQKTHFKGPVIAFLWPSQASLLKYTWDEANDEWTRYYAARDLAQIVSIAPKVTIIAHSMGNRVAGDAIAALDRNNPVLAMRIKTIVLASPDVDRDMFLRDFPDLLKVEGRRITVYASAHDKALHLSAGVHGNRQAGDLSCKFSYSTTTTARRSRCYPHLPNAVGMTIVDTTAVSTGNGHADFIESPAGAADLCRVINGIAVQGRDATTNPRAVLLMKDGAFFDDGCQATP